MMSGTFAVLRRVVRYPSGAAGLAMIGLVVLMAILAPFLYPGGPWEIAGRPFLWPGQNPAFPLGTDALGRDIAAGVFFGARVSLLIGVAAVLAATLLGVSVGAIAGYFGGWTDSLLMRVTEAIQTVPGFLFAIVVVAVLSPTVFSITGAIAIISWPTIARLTRAEVLKLRKSEFVDSCRVIGMGNIEIIYRQILPNSMAPIIVSSSVLVATAIIIEAGLAFLGLGDPNLMSWGTMIGAGRASLRTAWYISMVPGGVMVVAVLGLNLLGDALNDALNPRLQRRA